MKILIVINDYLNKSNGMCISTQRFVKQFKRLGYDVRIMTNKRYGETEYPLKVLKIPIFSGLIEKEGFTFAKINKKTIRKAVEWADVVHLEDPFLLCRRAAIEAARRNKAITATFHLYPENATYAIHLGRLRFLNHLIMKMFFSCVYKRCDYIQCPTADVKKRLTKYCRSGNMEVISNGIDESFLHNRRDRSFDGTLNLLSVGRYASEKDQATLIKAISHCKHKDRIHVSIAGKGPLEHKLRELAAKLNVNIDFGFLSQDRLKEQMLASDLYVHCAEIEVEGMSCMEAFACGCVPIISDARLSSTKSFALHESNIFKHGNAKNLAQKIDYFFENPDRLRQQSEEYIGYAEKQSVSNCAERLVRLMEKAYAEGGRA